MTASGKLRHRISIEQRVEEFDDVGQPVDAWTGILHAFASIEDRRGRETLEGGPMDAGQVIVNVVTTNITIRYRPEVQPEMRVVDICSRGHCNGQVYNITNVRDLNGRARELLLESERVRALTGAPV